MSIESERLSPVVSGFISGGAGALVVTVVVLGVLMSQGVLKVDSPLRSLVSGKLPSAETTVAYSATEELVINAVKKSSPSVVSIVISKDVPVVEQYFEESPTEPFGGFFDPFNFGAPRYRQNGTEKREVGGGSGFLVSSDGMILTNRHVVTDEDAEYTVFLNDGSKYEATVLARDPVFDLAVIKIKGSDFPYLSFADSDSLQVGQSVIAIGNALAEFRNSVSVGIVSGLSRSVIAGSSAGQSELLEDVIQTDAAINPGNSGGPLLTLGGEVIGVNVAVASGSENIGFALRGNLAKSVVDSVVKTGTIIRPYLGVRYRLIDEHLKELNFLPVDYGVLVVRGETPDELAVIPGSPADKAGIVENDVILEVDGVKIERGKSLVSLIRQKKAGDIVLLKVFHKGEEKNISITLEDQPIK